MLLTKMPSEPLKVVLSRSVNVTGCLLFSKFDTGIRHYSHRSVLKYYFRNWFQHHSLMNNLKYVFSFTRASITLNFCDMNIQVINLVYTYCLKRQIISEKKIPLKSELVHKRIFKQTMFIYIFLAIQKYFKSQRHKLI